MKSKSYIIPARSGVKINVKSGQTVTIIDVEGKQVVDFFAEVTDSIDEFLSTGVTIDCNESLNINVGDTIYTNLYRPMFKVLYDDVKKHDLLHPCCRKEMYDFFYKNGDKHPNCLDNINDALEKAYPIITPINFFMNTGIKSDGSISVETPVSEAGDKIVLLALLDVTLGVAACSVSESKCNGGKCTSVEIIVEG